MTNNQLTSTHLAVKSELDGYKIHASRGQATALAMVALFESIDNELTELQERRKADSEPVAVPDHLTYLQNPTLENVLSDAEENSPMAHAARILAREVKFWRSVPLYRHAQPSLVPDKMTYQDGVLFVLNNDMSSIERGTVAMRAWNACRAAMLQGADGKPELTVWYGAMPETNGKTNWTAILHREGQHPWEGITIDRSEYPDRVRYEADRMRHLIGELADEPDILAYDAEAHSGYVYPGNSPVIPDGYVMVPKEPTKEMIDAGWLHFMGTKNPSSKGTYKAMLAAAPQEVNRE
ncbi:hypothetical protein FMJ68_00200 [Klebsiella grimontii]|uniref:hypothetical protein n=1 Tax=Klebsiella grimontii TaxID=2058152 RepID=UPI001CCFB49B|nr:hypothetical protein [Klebsiella grimontii]MBZ6567124.1 hypothetical protein [Klebsiella grimontii]MBZ7376104.1 hypothetical protein [Klebsiella grimontii]